MEATEIETANVMTDMDDHQGKKSQENDHMRVMDTKIQESCEGIKAGAIYLFACGGFFEYFRPSLSLQHQG